MDGFDLALAKLDSALGNTGTPSDAAQLKTPTGSQVSAKVRSEARAATRSGDRLGAVHLLLEAAVAARAVVPVGVLDDVEACIATLDSADPDPRHDEIAAALTTLRNPPPAPRRGLFGFRRR